MTRPGANGRRFTPHTNNERKPGGRFHAASAYEQNDAIEVAQCLIVLGQDMPWLDHAPRVASGAVQAVLMKRTVTGDKLLDALLENLRADEHYDAVETLL